MLQIDLSPVDPNWWHKEERYLPPAVTPRAAKRKLESWLVIHLPTGAIYRKCPNLSLAVRLRNARNRLHPKQYILVSA